MNGRRWTNEKERKSCQARQRLYYDANAETLKAKRRARYRAKALRAKEAA
jgi:hypothetical protein